MERTSSRPVGHYHSYPTRTLTTSGLDIGDLPPITEQSTGTYSQRPSSQLEEVPLDGFRFSGNSIFPNIADMHNDIFPNNSAEANKRVPIQVDLTDSLDSGTLAEVISPGGKTVDMTQI